MTLHIRTLLLALALVASACGSSGTDTDSSAAEAEPAETTTSEAPTDDAEESVQADASEQTETDAPTPTDDAAVGKPIVEPPSAAPVDLEITDLVAGDGATAMPGDYLTMHYVGVRQTDGVQFDASWDRGQTFGFTLGAGMVIQGWDQGIEGMQVGGRRMLSIPSGLAYGDRGAGADIPPGADLVFVVDLLNVATPPEVENAPAPVTELEVEVLTEGSGDEIAVGSVIELHYVLLSQATGEIADSSWTAQPIRYQISEDPAASVVPGWDEALVGKRVGDHVRIVLPPELVGPQLTAAVGEGTLVTEVTIISVN